jgi:DNA-binding MarR family transcriptional regulator
MRSFPKVSELGRMGEQRCVLLSIASYVFMEHCAARLAPFNLTLSRSLALAYIDAHPSCDQTSLGKAMGMNRGSTMQLVDNLERLSFVRRDPGADRRSNALHLTREGRKAFEEALKVDEAIVDSALSSLNERDWRVVFKLMRAIFNVSSEQTADEASTPG